MILTQHVAFVMFEMLLAFGFKTKPVGHAKGVVPLVTLSTSAHVAVDT
jgi:hypothetical protein